MSNSFRILSVLFFALIVGACGTKWNAPPGSILHSEPSLVEALGFDVYPRHHFYVVNGTHQPILVECGRFRPQIIKPGERVTVRAIGHGGYRDITCFANMIGPRGERTAQVDHKTISVGGYYNSSRDTVWVVKEGGRRW
jgi:hypothetical protein